MQGCNNDMCIVILQLGSHGTGYYTGTWYCQR